MSISIISSSATILPRDSWVRSYTIITFPLPTPIINTPRLPSTHQLKRHPIYIPLPGYNKISPCVYTSYIKSLTPSWTLLITHHSHHLCPPLPPHLAFPLRPDVLLLGLLLVGGSGFLHYLYGEIKIAVNLGAFRGDRGFDNPGLQVIKTLLFYLFFKLFYSTPLSVLPPALTPCSYLLLLISCLLPLFPIPFY